MNKGAQSGWLYKLKSRWELGSLFDVVIVLIVFALTGSTVVVIKPYILQWIFGGAEISGWFTILYYILILPIYNLLLLIYGLIFGKFYFFWKFERKFFERLFRFKSKGKK